MIFSFTYKQLCTFWRLIKRELLSALTSTCLSDRNFSATHIFISSGSSQSHIQNAVVFGGRCGLTFIVLINDFYVFYTVHSAVHYQPPPWSPQSTNLLADGDDWFLKFFNRCRLGDNVDISEPLSVGIWNKTVEQWYK